MKSHYPGSPIPSEKEFLMVHRNKDYPFHNLHMPGQNEFGRCNDCAELNEAFWVASTPEEKKDALEKRNVHDRMVDVDHAWYIMDKAFCARHSDQKAFIALDQSSLEPGIPVHHPPKKMFDRKSRLEVHLGGGINFSMGEENPVNLPDGIYGSVGLRRCFLRSCQWGTRRMSCPSGTAATQSPYLVEISPSYWRPKYDERAKQYLNDIATFGEWAPVMEGMPQGLPKPAAPTREVLRDKVVTTLKKLLKHPMLIHGADRKDWVESFVHSDGKTDGVRVVGEHELGCVGRAGQLLVNGQALNLRVLEAESLPPLNMIRSANLRCTVADEQLKAMIAANDDGRVHLKIVPSAAKRFDNIQKLEHEDVIVEEISEDNSAAAAGKGPSGALPVCPTLRESQLEGSFKEFEARVELDNQEIEVVKQKYHKLKKAVLKTTSSAQTKPSTDRNSAAPESSAVPTSLREPMLPPHPSTSRHAKRQATHSRRELQQDKVHFLVPKHRKMS
eukprot:g17664.t1